MEETGRFSWRKRAKSFRYAWNGIVWLLRTAHNARIHCVVAVAVIVAGCLLHISPGEWAVVVLCIGAVLAAEAFNSAIESLADRVTREQDDAICHVKDLAAGAVLLVAVAVVAAGLWIFLPKIIGLFA